MPSEQGQGTRKTRVRYALSRVVVEFQPPAVLIHTRWY